MLSVVFLSLVALLLYIKEVAQSNAPFGSGTHRMVKSAALSEQLNSSEFLKKNPGAKLVMFGDVLFIESSSCNMKVSISDRIDRLEQYFSYTDIPGVKALPATAGHEVWLVNVIRSSEFSEKSALASFGVLLSIAEELCDRT